MNTVGLERRWIETSKFGARFGLRGPLVALAACVVFAGSFGLSRVTHSGGASPSEAAPTPPASAVTAAIPVSLASAQPIETTLEPPPPPRPKPVPALRAPAPVSSPAPEAPAAATPAPQPSAPSAPAPAAPAPERAAPAP